MWAGSVYYGFEAKHEIVSYYGFEAKHEIVSYYGFEAKHEIVSSEQWFFLHCLQPSPVK